MHAKSGGGPEAAVMVAMEKVILLLFLKQITSLSLVKVNRITRSAAVKIKNRHSSKFNLNNGGLLSK